MVTAQLLPHADNKLFASLTKPTHCANYLLPPIKPYVRTLRSRGHNYTLPKCKYIQHKNSLFVAICIVRLILKLRGLDVNFVCV